MSAINPHCCIGKVTFKPGVHPLPTTPTTSSIEFFRGAIEMAVQYEAQAVGAFIIAADGRVVSAYHQDQAHFSQLVAGAVALKQRVLGDWE